MWDSVIRGEENGCAAWRERRAPGIEIGRRGGAQERYWWGTVWVWEKFQAEPDLRERYWWGPVWVWEKRQAKA